nr:MAG TPA: hypothetical protein [Caudoviricetes sp.]
MRYNNLKGAQAPTYPRNRMRWSGYHNHYLHVIQHTTLRL